MTSRSSSQIGILTILQLLLAAYLVLLGIQGIEQYNAPMNEFSRAVTSFFGQKTNPFNLIFAIVEIAAGVALALTLFLPAGLNLNSILNIAAAIVWVVKIILTSFVNGISTSNKALHFNPNFEGWLMALVLDLIILLCIWMAARKRN